MEDFRGKVSAKQPPSWSVEGRADVMLITRDNFADRKCWRAVCKDSSVLDKGLIGKRVSSDEDCRARAYSESDDMAVFGTQVAKNGLEF